MVLFFVIATMSTKSNHGSASMGDSDAVSVRAIIARSRPEDYDGHTEFLRLTPRERLAWLDAAVMLWEAHGVSVEEPPARVPPSKL